ncbi:MAG: SAM-dependent methyltransferase [Salinivirgaceae bacterium]|nr:MAG: SAM-dependent methyltransferase [Salinivirgaceae bacterium]
MEVKPIQTEDGSHSLYVPELDEHYHSTKGAVQESKHIFIDAGLHYLNLDTIRILEIGFGTGLNAFYTLLESQNRQLNISYTGLEKYPLKTEITSQLNYPELLNHSRLHFDVMHQTKWEEEVNITDTFSLKKIEADLASWSTNEMFDLIYFDAFGPDKQPEMWTSPIFHLMGKCLNSGGVLVTYSAKGDVRRGFKAAGMEIQKIPGPPGKKHMTRAIKI